MSKTPLHRFAEAKSTDEIFDDPEAFGLPTFEQFSKSPEKWVGREDDRLMEVDRGSTMLNKHVQRHIYEIEGFRCKSIEEVERVALSQGIPLRELDYRPQVVPSSAGKCDLLVRFVSKKKRDERKDW